MLPNKPSMSGRGGFSGFLLDFHRLASICYFCHLRSFVPTFGLFSVHFSSCTVPVSTAGLAMDPSPSQSTHRPASRLSYPPNPVVRFGNTLLSLRSYYCSHYCRPCHQRPASVTRCTTRISCLTISPVPASPKSTPQSISKSQPPPHRPPTASFPSSKPPAFIAAPSLHYSSALSVPIREKCSCSASPLRPCALPWR